MRVRITIEYDPDWSEGCDLTQAHLTEIEHWATNQITVSDVISIGGKFDLEIIP